MMSAHDLAAAALKEVASNQHLESRPRKFASSRSLDDPTATSMELSTSKTAPGVDLRETDASAGFQSSSSNNSQTTVPDVTTPPTSQEFVSESQESTPQLSILSRPVASQLPLAQLADAVVQPPSLATNAGQKRTFEGYVKPAGSSSSSSTSPPLRSAGGHSRNTSIANSASSAISSRELVSELRTRLSYAIVKVNNGWESLPIEEVESLTSAPTSPASTVQGRRNIITSPRTTIANLQRYSNTASSHSNIGDASVPHNDSAPFSDSQPSRTYESFWREQSQRSQLSSNLVSPASSHLSLAPPADITSATKRAPHPRRSETPRFTKPPTLLGQSTSSSLSQNSNASLVGTHTPTPRTPNRTTTHSVDAMTNHKSLQERDAIESLLFMSSPGNSKNMNHTFPPPHGGQGSNQTSPLRTEFGAPLLSAPLLGGAQGARNVASAASLRPKESVAAKSFTRTSDFGRQSDPGSARAVQVQVPRRPGDDVYDLMLDSMRDESESSDDEEIEIEIPITPRRMTTAGRI